MKIESKEKIYKIRNWIGLKSISLAILIFFVSVTSAITTDANSNYKAKVVPDTYLLTAFSEQKVVQNFVLQKNTSTTGAVVTIQDINGNNNITGIVNSTNLIYIVVKNVQNLAATTIELSYDPNLIVVQNITAGKLGVLVSNINNSLGISDISTFSTNGVSGNVTVANLSIKIIGTGTSPLTLNVSTLSDANANLIPYSINNGQISGISILRGDMDCDGKVDIGDALLIAQYTVGLRSTPYTC